MKNIFNIKIVYSIVILSLIFWAFFAFFTMNQLITTQQQYAKLINISGKQRMLSQKTALMTKRVFETNKKELIEHLQFLIETMKKDNEFILNNLKTEKMMDIYLGNNLNLNSEVKGYFRLLDSFIQQNGNPYLVDNITLFSFQLLPKLDFAVNAFEEESDYYIKKLKEREFFILIGTLLTIFIEAILIVIPSIKRIKISEDELKNLNQSLEDKIEEQKQIILKEQKEIKEKEKVFYEQAKLISMGEMIGNIAHQWRQPLSIITTLTSTLNLKLDYKEKIEESLLREYSSKIFDQAIYLSKTIDDFRNFIKGSDKHIKVKVSEVIDDTLNILEASLKTNYINVIRDTEEDLFILANKNEIQQALINILKNAKDALNSKKSEDKLILIKTKLLDENELILFIKDNAGGIDEKIINRIFEPYFTTKHPSVGTGIGLSMVDKIIRERHKFFIKAENEEFTYKDKTYKGACFQIIFKK